MLLFLVLYFGVADKTFWAFNFELTDSHLFQQKLMQALHDNDVTFVASSNWSCLLISAPKVHCRVQPTAARRSGRFNKMHGALRALHMSLNNASTRTVCKWLKRNNGHLKLSKCECDARSYFETFIRSPKQFLNQKSHWRRYGTVFCRSS